MKIAEAVLALTGEDAAGIRGLFLDKIDNALKLFCDACGVDLLRLGEEGYRREFLGNRLEEKGKELLGMLFSCRFSVDPHKGKATGKKGPGRPVKDTYSAETTLVVLLELLPLAGRWLWAAEE
jgi:hypothetical protein